MPDIAGLDKYRDHGEKIAREAYPGLGFSASSGGNR